MQRSSESPSAVKACRVSVTTVNVAVRLGVDVDVAEELGVALGVAVELRVTVGVTVDVGVAVSVEVPEACERWAELDPRST